MADLLELARQHANKAIELDPERAKLVAEKRRWLDAKAGEVYAALQPLAGEIVTYNGKEARLQVSRRGDRAELCIMEREMFKARDGEMRHRDTSNQLAKCMGCGITGGYRWAGLGAESDFAQLDDLVKHVAAEIGPLLKLEA